MNTIKICTGGLLRDIEPRGDMVLCDVISFDGEKDQAVWGNSGAMGEPYSFFEPVGGSFKASEIESWEVPDNSAECPYCQSDNEAIKDVYFAQTCKGCVDRMGTSPKSR